MQIINIKWGLIGFMFGISMVILFNQNISIILEQANDEFEIILKVTWLILCFLIGGYAPMALTIPDDTNGVVPPQ